MKTAIPTHPAKPWPVTRQHGLYMIESPVDQDRQYVFRNKEHALLFASAEMMLAALQAWERWYSDESSEYVRDSAREEGCKAIAAATKGGAK